MVPHHFSLIFPFSWPEAACSVLGSTELGCCGAAGESSQARTGEADRGDVILMTASLLGVASPKRGLIPGGVACPLHRWRCSCCTQTLTPWSDLTKRGGYPPLPSAASLFSAVIFTSGWESSCPTPYP